MSVEGGPPLAPRWVPIPGAAGAASPGAGPLAHALLQGGSEGLGDDQRGREKTGAVILFQYIVKILFFSHKGEFENARQITSTSNYWTMDIFCQKRYAEPGQEGLLARVVTSAVDRISHFLTNNQAPSLSECCEKLYCRGITHTHTYTF